MNNFAFHYLTSVESCFSYLSLRNYTNSCNYVDTFLLNTVPYFLTQTIDNLYFFTKRAAYTRVSSVGDCTYLLIPHRSIKYAIVNFPSVERALITFSTYYNCLGSSKIFNLSLASICTRTLGNTTRHLIKPIDRQNFTY